jgi:cytidylate kinase
MEGKLMDKGKKFLMVVGGPGGSGASTISEMLANHFGLKRVYAGSLFRKIIKEKGYEDFESFFKKGNEDELMKIDEEVDRKLIDMINSENNLLIESKIFSAIASIKNIPCTAKIWIDASLHRRALRHLENENIKGCFKKFFRYFKIRRDLRKRWRIDSFRYKKLYGVDYSKPNVYYDIVVDSSRLNEEETVDLILKRLRDGRYIEKE